MSITDGQPNNQARMRRVQASIPPSYTIFTSGLVTRAECNIPGGTDYNDSGDPDPDTVIANAIAAANGGHIHIKNVTINNTITLQTNWRQKLTFETLNLGADVDAIHLNGAGASKVHGSFITANALASYSKSLIKITDGLEHKVYVGHLVAKGGNLIEIHGDTPTGAAGNDIAIQKGEGYDKAFYLHADAGSWANLNYLKAQVISSSRANSVGWYLDKDAGSVGGNIIYNSLYQSVSVATSIPAYVKGNNNIFSNVCFSDVVGGENLQIIANSYYTRFIGCDIPVGNLTDNGTGTTHIAWNEGNALTITTSSYIKALLRLYLPQIAGDPSVVGWGAGEKGIGWFNTSSNLAKYWDGSGIRIVLSDNSPPETTVNLGKILNIVNSNYKTIKLESHWDAAKVFSIINSTDSREYASWSNDGFMIFTDVNSLPGAAAAYRKHFALLLGGVGVSDKLYLCMKNSANNYAWQVIHDPG